MRHHVRWWSSKGLLQTTVSILVGLKMEKSLVINCDGMSHIILTKLWTPGNFGRTWGNKKFSFKTWVWGPELSSRALTGVFPLWSDSSKRILSCGTRQRVRRSWTLSFIFRQGREEEWSEHQKQTEHKPMDLSEFSRQIVQESLLRWVRTTLRALWNNMMIKCGDTRSPMTLPL